MVRPGGNFFVNDIFDLALAPLCGELVPPLVARVEGMNE
jgi:hypothetical protein